MIEVRALRALIVANSVFIVNDVLRILAWPLVGLPWESGVAAVTSIAVSVSVIRFVLRPWLREARAAYIAELEKEVFS